MKVCLFEVRGDEKKDIESCMKQYPNMEVVCYKGNFSLENIADIRGAKGISILGGTKMDKELLNAVKEAGVTCLSTRTVGCDHIDMAYAEEIGISVFNAGYPPNAVADFAVMLMLIAIRKYKPALWRQQVNDYSLPGLQGRNINELTVGIIGTGKIGQQVALNLSGFGCKILAFDSFTQSDRLKGIAEYVPLDVLYKQSDIITFHVPFLPENEAMINETSIKKMKDGVILINTARGELMDLEAVISGVESEKIGGVAMDVFENDIGIYHVNHKSDILVNPRMAYFRQFPNVVLTQHMAFYTEQSVSSMVQSAFNAFNSI